MKFIFFIICLAFIENVYGQSGSCGVDCIFKFYTNQEELEISGSGPMFDFPSDGTSNQAKWSSLVDSIKIVIIEGVSSIGIGVFEFCNQLTTVTMTSSVTSICQL